MGLVVQKFGGTSVANVEKIKNVAQKVIREKKAGNDVVVVLSAMAGETNRLIDLATSAAETPDEREYDSLISTGEQVTITLLSIVLNSMGYPARSFLGFQVPIVTDKSYQKARISKVGTDIIGKELKDGKVVIVAGFQGIDEDNNITTLGRGGSDTSAVALAAALNATRCDIYTDVDGVYMADPAICPKARRLDKVSYEEMLEMSMTGAKVLQPRSVEMAQKYNVPVYVRSSFSDKGGTLVTKEDKKMEKEVLSGITYDRDQAKITAIHIPDKPGVAANLFTALSEHNISVDMIIQNISAQGHTDLTFTVAKKDAKQAHKIVDAAAKEIGARKVEINDDVAKISIIGVGMVSHSGVAAKMFKTLADEGINIMMISTSEIKISCVIQRRYTELAVSALHEAFQLGRKNKKQMFANQVRGTIIMCVCLAMVPLFLFLDSLLPEKDVPVLATHFQDSLVVEICDAGDSSGIYYLRPGTTAGQLFRDIGSRFPLKEDFTIKNGASLLPTSEGEVIIGQMKAAKRLALGLPLDVNLASEEDLMMIPGIGPKMSAAIAVYRKENRWIKSIDQLREIRGIGEKKLSRLKGYLYVDEQSP